MVDAEPAEHVARGGRGEHPPVALQLREFGEVFRKGGCQADSGGASEIWTGGNCRWLEKAGEWGDERGEVGCASM